MASTRELICENLIDTYRGMTQGAGYCRDWKGFSRHLLAEEPPEKPALAVIDPHEDVSALAYPLHDRSLDIEVRGLHDVPATRDNNPSRAGTEMIEDIERASMVDPTRGGLAVDTELKGSDKFPGWPGLDNVSVVVYLRIRYRTTHTDPSEAR